MSDTIDRSIAALAGLAIGDALGMPTQLMSRRSVRERFGTIEGFEPAAADHPIAANMPAASVTDDTEQALLVARELMAGHGHVDPAALANALITWEDDMRKRGSLDLLGPSTKAAVAAVLAGTPVAEAGRYGTTNGAAMRVAPVGILMPSGDLDALVDRVVEVSSVTHNTGVAIAGASAVAAAVSAGIDGAGVAEAIEVACRAAEIGAERGYWVAGGDVSRRIRLAVSLVDANDEGRSLTDVLEIIGTSLASQESVPAAFALLALFADDPWRGCLAAANLGGDSDTVGAILGAMGGACTGLSGFPSHALESVIAVNSLDLEPLSAGLLALRAGVTP